MHISFIEKLDNFSINHIVNNQNDYLEDGDDGQKLILNLFNNSAVLAEEMSNGVKAFCFEYWPDKDMNWSDLQTTVDMEKFDQFFELYQNNKLVPDEVTEEQAKLLKCSVYVKNKNDNNMIIVFDIEGENVLNNQLPSKLNIVSYKLH